LLPGNAHAGWHCWCRAFGNKFGRSFFAFRYSGRRSVGEIHPGVLSMMQPEPAVLPGIEVSRATPGVKSSAGKSDQPAVLLRALHKSFGSQIVLDGIELSIASGETLAVLGRSGTGKSVLLKLIIGLQIPDSGSILIQGQEIVGFPIDAMNELRK